jgi:hypothetical protein
MDARIDNALQLVRTMCSVRATTQDLRDLAERECAREQNLVRASVKIKDALEAQEAYYEERVRRTQEVSTRDQLYARSERICGAVRTCEESSRQEEARLRRLAEGRPVVYTDREGVATTIYYRKARAGAGEERERDAKKTAEKEGLRARHREIATKLRRMQMEPTPRVPTMPAPRTLGDEDYEIYLRAFQRHRDTERANERRRHAMAKMEKERTTIERRLRQPDGGCGADAWEGGKRERREQEYATMAKQRKVSHAAKTTVQ